MELFTVDAFHFGRKCSHKDIYARYEGISRMTMSFDGLRWNQDVSFRIQDVSFRIETVNDRQDGQGISIQCPLLFLTEDWTQEIMMES